MATGVDTLNLDQEQIFKSIGSFWDRYKQRDVLGKFWESVAQILDNEYNQVFQANFSKSVLNVPIEWHYQWILFELTKTANPGVVHDHFFVRLTATGGETKIALTGATTPVKVILFLNGVFLSEDDVQPGVNWRFLPATNEAEFFTALTAGDEVFIAWIEEGDAFDRRHNHLVFEELLTGSKSSWTSAAGDAFDPAGAGSYDSGSTIDPIEVFVNGVQQPSAAYTETSDTVLDLSVSLIAGDHILFRWRRPNTASQIHSHLRFAEVLATTKSTINLPFSDDDPAVRTEFVYVNGIMQFLDIDYKFDELDEIEFIGVSLTPGDVFEIEFHGDAFLFLYEIDPDIIRIPFLQDGIDEKASGGPTFLLTEGIDFNIVEIGGKNFIEANKDLEGVAVWAPDIFVNEKAIQKNFGDPVSFVRDNSTLYLQATQALWKAFWRGPNVDVIEDAIKALLGLPITSSGGTVKQVLTDSAGIDTVEFLDGTTVTIPDGFKATVTAGQVLEPVTALSDGVELIDVIVDPHWINQVPDLAKEVDSKFFEIDAMPGFFDECSGIWDDGGDLDVIDGDFSAINQKLFDALKNHTCLIRFNAAGLNQIAIGTP